MQTRTGLLLLLVASELSGALIAQTPIYIAPSMRRGQASRWPAAALIRNDTNSGILIKAPLDADASGVLTAPTPPIAPTQQAGDWRMDALFPNLGHIQLDAIASGNALIPDPDASGVPMLGSNQWLGLTLSLSSTSQPAAGSAFALGGSSGSSLASYYLRASQGISPDLLGSLTLETSRSNFGLPPATPTAPNDITGLDYGIGFWNRLPSAAPSVLFTEKKLFFFSVTAGWANNNSASTTFAEDPRTVPSSFHPPHAATIYSMAWDHTSGTWSGPFVYAHAEWLGLAGGDLDALEVDAIQHNIIYSAVGNSFEPSRVEGGVGNQLMILNLESDGAKYLANLPAGVKAHRLADRNGATVVRLGAPDPAVTGLGHPDDEVDAVCTIDPENMGADSFAGISVNHAYGPTVGASEAMGMSIVRLEAPTRDPVHQIQVTGWGATLPMQDWLVLYRHDSVVQPWPAPLPTTGWVGPIKFQRREPFQSQWTFTVEPSTSPWAIDGVTYLATGQMTQWTRHSSSAVCVIKN